MDDDPLEDKKKRAESDLQKELEEFMSDLQKHLIETLKENELTLQLLGK